MAKSAERRTMLRASGQLGRLILSIYAVMIGLVALAFFSAASPLGIGIQVAGACVGCALVAGGWWLATSIKCPACSTRWFGWAQTNLPAGQWLAWLTDTKECPKCDFHAE